MKSVTAGNPFPEFHHDLDSLQSENAGNSCSRSEVWTI